MLWRIAVPLSLAGAVCGTGAACSSHPTSEAAESPGLQHARAFVEERQPNRRELVDENEIYDPWEPLNRKTFAFNRWADQWFAKPLAKAYRAVLPDGVERVISRMLANFEEPANIGNHLLQVNPIAASSSLLRLAINSTVGLLGMIDVASAVGLPSRKTDLGLTLAAWGVGSGPYLVAPLLGPSNLRDFPAPSLATSYSTREFWSLDEPDQYAETALSLLDQRVRILPQEEQLLSTLEGISDQYVFLRGLSVQLRKAAINGSSGGDDFDDDDFSSDDFGDDDFGGDDDLGGGDDLGGDELDDFGG